MFKNTAVPVDAKKCAFETAAIIAGSVVFAAPACIIDVSKPPPELAPWMSHYGVRPRIFSSIPRNVPHVNAVKL